MNALILHGTDNTSQDNWFPWLGKQLEAKGWNVYIPDLPQSEHPDPGNYNPFLKDNVPFALDKNTVLIGHSSGAVAALHYLQYIRPAEPVHATYLISGFIDDLGWEALKDMFTPGLDYDLLQTLAEEYIIMHSKDDPYVPLKQAHTLAKLLDARLIEKNSEGHFSTGSKPEYTKFPELLSLISAD